MNSWSNLTTKHIYWGRHRVEYHGDSDIMNVTWSGGWTMAIGCKGPYDPFRDHLYIALQGVNDKLAEIDGFSQEKHQSLRKQMKSIQRM